ncbi:MAG TPA: site-2 protease family protein [Candidatus Saccharimonadales bacterium]|nr:site-2 protease family protein [Candidatus Saccharimonadales bacterium]
MFSNLSLHDIGIVLVAILISMAFHEAMHAFTAHALGDTTAQEEGRLTLNPLRHIDILTTVLLPVVLLAIGLSPIFIAKPVPFDPHRVRYGEYGAALVALAGPFTNFMLAVGAAMLIRFFGLNSGETAYVLGIFIEVNIAFFVFNLLPLPPLDGSRLLYAVAPEPLQQIMYRIETAGFGVTILLLLVLMPFIGPLLANINQAIFTFLLH